MFNKKTDQSEPGDQLEPVAKVSAADNTGAKPTSDQKVPESEWEKQAKANLAGWQKALADYQNLQKDTEKKFSQLRDFVKIDLLHELLPIFDHYQQALAHVPDDIKKESWVLGLEHTLKRWETFLTDHGIKKIETIGQSFNTRWHESIGMVQDKEKADQLIVEEKQAGYALNDMVIRPAKVIINNISK